jgi:hypothetical protein
MKKFLPIIILLITFTLSVIPVKAESSRRWQSSIITKPGDECATYINGEHAGNFTDEPGGTRSKGHINQRENRTELNQMNDSLGVPLELQSHLVTFY